MTTDIARWPAPLNFNLDIQRPTKGLLLIGAVLCALQIADGVLTAIGVGKFGIESEANLLIRDCIAEFGCVPTLAAFKTLSIALIILIVLLAQHRAWISHALKGLTCVYAFGAVIPWAFMLAIY